MDICKILSQSQADKIIRLAAWRVIYQITV